MSKSVLHHGKRVSEEHATVLAAYERKTGRTLYVNQGRRTLAEQAKFWADWIRFRRVLAARPYPGAPHIKYGRAHHALDINAEVVRDVALFYKSLGIPVAFNVAGEPWHMDTLSEAKLKSAAAKLKGTSRPTLKRGQKGPSVVALKKLLYAKGVRGFSAKGGNNRFDPFFSKYTESAVKRFQKSHGIKADGVVGPGTWKALR